MALPFLRRNAWKLAAAFTVAVALAYVFLRDTKAGPTVYALAGLLAFVAFAVGPAMQGSRALQWKLFAAGFGLYTVADASWAVYTWIGWAQPYPSWADGVYLAAYALFVLGVLVLLRGRRPRTGDVLGGLRPDDDRRPGLRRPQPEGALRGREQPRLRLDCGQRPARGGSAAPVGPPARRARRDPARQARIRAAVDRRRRARGPPARHRRSRSQRAPHPDP